MPPRKPSAEQDGGAAPAPAKPAYKFPKTLGACADRLYQLKEKQAEAQRVVDAIDAERKALTAHVIETLPKSEATGVAGKLARVRVVTKEVPQVSDWVAFYAYVHKTKRGDLLQRRLNEKAVGELIEANPKKGVPGVGVFKAITISLTKV